MDKIDANTVKKIHDLMRLAGSSNANEAASAYARAQGLLTKYRLTMAEIEDRHARESNPIKSGDPIFEAERIPSWMVLLATVIAELNACQALVFHGSGSRKLVLIGRKDDIEIVAFLFESIVAQIHYLSHAARLNKLGTGKTFFNNFKMGIVETVSVKLKEATAAVRKEYTGTQAIVLVDQRAKDVALYVESVIKPKNIKIPGLNLDTDGYKQGLKAGHKVNINPGIKAPDIKNQLK